MNNPSAGRHPRVTSAPSAPEKCCKSRACRQNETRSLLLFFSLCLGVWAVKSLFRHARIYFIAPRQNSAHQKIFFHRRDAETRSLKKIILGFECAAPLL